ncbi:MAG: DUF3990 domain-containing protein [Atopobiaceae bacterium]|nr:DUF3990 domain-containing protein [Atopobiaceae bacterium]
MIFREGTTLYHGSYLPVEMPDLAQCRSGKDFGRGFYLTTDYDQAVSFVRLSIRKAVFDKRVPESCSKGYVSDYVVGSTVGLECLEFPYADAEWLHCVVAHRKQVGAATAKWDRFDTIEGKIANDNTNVVINAYMNGVYGEIGSQSAVSTAIGLLEPENLKNQVCLRTANALAVIPFTGSTEVRL